MSPFTFHLSPLTCHLAPVSSHLSPRTSHLAPLTSHLHPQFTFKMEENYCEKCDVWTKTRDQMQARAQHHLPVHLYSPLHLFTLLCTSLLPLSPLLPLAPLKLRLKLRLNSHLHLFTPPCTSLHLPTPPGPLSGAQGGGQPPEDVCEDPEVPVQPVPDRRALPGRCQVDVPCQVTSTTYLGKYQPKLLH